MNNIWQGKRIRLRAVEPSDWEHFFNWNFDTEQARAVDRVWPPQSAEGSRRWAAEQAAAKFSDGDYMWIIETLDGGFAGCINTFDCNRRVGAFKYGLSVHPDYRRQGFASEAIALVLRYFFDELRYQKVTVLVYSFNEASLKMHKRLGFQPEGCLRRVVYTHGQYFDELYFGMTREEFETTPCRRRLHDGDQVTD